MPTVLITGISGFVATHVAKVFLENGWTVRGTVRSEAKAQAAKALPVFKKYQDNLEFAIIDDIAEGDFSEALKGVNAIAHTASPFHTTGQSWENDYKGPAVKGTTNVLNAALKVPSIKNVVVTSSFAAILDPSTPATAQTGRVYSEEDWNPVTDEACQSVPADAPYAGGMWYCASKKLAEEAAFEIAKGASWKLATIDPPMIFGPALQSITSLDSVNTSTAAIYQLFKKDGSSIKAGIPETVFPVFADVRDVAKAHYEAVVRGKTGRYAICSGFYDFQLVADYLRKNFPEIRERVPEGNPGQYSKKEVYVLNAEKARKELGIDYTPFEKSIHDTVVPLLAFEKDQ